MPLQLPLAWALDEEAQAAKEEGMYYLAQTMGFWSMKPVACQDNLQISLIHNHNFSPVLFSVK